MQDPPGKVTTTETIYTSLAKWDYIAELDFADFYYQLPFKVETARDRLKLAYLCIRTARGTKCFRVAPMGLLGMDIYQADFTDLLFGDLVLSGRLCKIADNVYFGGKTFQEVIQTSDIILDRCKKADLRIKPSKVKINIKSADILGLHWCTV